MICPDVPELVAEGDTRAEALERAVDALVTALSFYVDEEKPAPVPSSAKGRTVVAVPVMEVAKLALHDAMVAAGVSNVEMARRLGRDEKQVGRLPDPLQRSHIGIGGDGAAEPGSPVGIVGDGGGLGRFLTQFYNRTRRNKPAVCRNGRS